MRWNHRHWGYAQDPIHKSQLNSITGPYGCPRAFLFAQERRAAGADDSADSVSGKTAAGTAAHETIARALADGPMRRHLLAGGQVTDRQVADVFAQELERETAGRSAQWYGKDPGKLAAERVKMITGLLNDLHHHVAEVVLVEPGFIMQCAGYWLSGHVDMLYRPRSAPSQLALADWKTGAQKPDPIELDHGWEAGVYSAAVHQGLFLPRESIELSRDGAEMVARVGGYAARHASQYMAERTALERALIGAALAFEVRTKRDPAFADDMHAAARELKTMHFGAFPTEIRYVHLPDLVPYQRASKRNITRRDELAYFGLDAPAEVEFKAGDRRGPGWLPVQLAAYDVPRLEHRLRNLVGTVRMGRFFERIGEHCTRCAFRTPCLDSGYAPSGQEHKRLDRALLRIGARDTELSLDD